MGNVSSRERREQGIALGWLGWSLHRIEQATAVRLETAGEYLRLAGVALQRRAAEAIILRANPGIEATTDFRGRSGGAGFKTGQKGHRRIF